MAYHLRFRKFGFEIEIRSRIGSPSLRDYKFRYDLGDYTVYSHKELDEQELADLRDELDELEANLERADYDEWGSGKRRWETMFERLDNRFDRMERIGLRRMDRMFERLGRRFKGLGFEADD